jgi:hypothetical protein
MVHPTFLGLLSLLEHRFSITMPKLSRCKIGHGEVTTIGRGGMGLSFAYMPLLPDEEHNKVRLATILSCT